MVQKDNEQQIEMLEKERAVILAELSRLRETLKAEIGSDIGEGEPELVGRDLVMTMIKSQQRKLESVEEALVQIQRGQYGICEKCGEPIDPERMEILPETTLCVKCKSSVEQRAF
jgi:DnaK suppressor protein